MSAIQSIVATSSLAYKGQPMGPKMTLDNDSSTAWCEGAKGLTGEALTITFKQPTTLSKITVEGGFYKTDKTLIKNGRVRAMTVSADNGWSEVFHFEFTPERRHSGRTLKVRQTVAPTPPKTTVLRFTIDKADKGLTTSDVCLSEIRLFHLN
jgi:hypothetical protein